MKKEQVCAADEKKVLERTPCCEKMGLKKGPWTPEEDQILVSFVHRFGHGNWRALPKQAGLLRCGKSCRLRWINYLRPDIKRGNFSKEEEETIIKLHQILGNRWSAIAAKLPGRTDNEIKNYWHTRLKKRPNLATIQAQQHCSNGIIQSPGDIQPVSQQLFRPESSDSVDTIRTGRVTDVSPGKVSGVERKCVARDVALMEAMKCDSSSDMEFWYNVFMKTGNSIEVQGNLDSMDR